MTNNPIELLISLAVNSQRSKNNIDENLKALKKYYDNNPLLLNVDIDRSKALANIQSFVKEASKQAISLDINIANDNLNRAKTQAQQIKDEFEKVNKIINNKKTSSASFDLDLDRVLIQLDNMGRKGIVATGQIAKFQAQIESLRGTNDRLSLKETTTDMFNVASGAKHADTVIEGLNQALIRIGASQQKLTNIKDKFNIDPHASDEYKRLEGVVERLTSDIIRLQTQASTGGSDQIKLAQQMREVQQRIAEATREMNNFSTASKNENAFAKLQKDAENMVKELVRTGHVSNQVIGDFQRDMAVISSSSESSVTKINRLTQAMDRLKEHAGEVKMNNRFNDQIDSQALSIEKLEAKILRIGTIHKNTVDKMEFRRLTEEARKLAEQLSRVETASDLRSVTKNYKALSGEVDKLGANAVTAAKASRGLVDTLGEAFRKFPVWAGMAALIYTPIRGIQDLIDKVIELDTALVQLQRVMDAPSYVFDEMIQSMISNVDALSGKTADYMQMVGDFARTGLDENQSQEYANVATVLQNISELTPDETINVLTAAMTAFGEETEGVMRIADRLNEIDNNFAITTRDLGLALNKTASSAKVYGVSLDEVLGYTTAIGVATRESGNIVGNSLKTIFARMTTNSSAINALQDIGISITDQAGEVRAVSDIIEELAGKWDSLTKAQQQNTSVGIAGMNQQNRFNALMLNYGMAVDATQASIQSQNSAMREQMIFSESLQARINRLQNAWYGFADAMGQQVLYDGIVVITQLLKAVTDGAGSLISSMGALAPLFGAVGVAIMIFSKNMRGLVDGMIAQASAAYGSSTATTIFGRAAAGASGAVKALNISVKSLLATLGVGVVFMAVGFALEKMFNIISKGIQEQEKLNQYTEKSTEAMGKNRESTQALIDKYKELNALKEYNSNAWSSENEQEYLQVQTQLAEVFPALIDNIDASGQAHLKSASAIDKVIASTDKLIVSQERAKISAAEDDFNKMFEDLSGKWYQSLSNFVYGSLEARIKQTKQVIKAMQESGEDTAKQEFELLQLEMQAAEASDKIKGHMLEIADSYAIVQKLEIDPNVQKSLESFIQTLDLSNLNAAEYKKFAKDFAEATAEMSRAAKDGDVKAYEEAVKKVNELAGKAKNGKDDFKKFSVSYDDFIKAIKKGQPPIVDAEGNIEDLTEATGALIDTNYEYKDSVEAMAGVTQKQVDDTSDLLFQYEMLTSQLKGYTDEELKNLENKKFLTAEERTLYKAYQDKELVMQQLLAIYPALLDADGKQIKMTDEKIAAIKAEQKAHEVLLKAVQLAKDGKLTAEQQATVAAAAGAQARIGFLQKEINMLDKYTRANSIAAKVAGAISLVAGVAMTAQQIAAEKALEGYRSELSSLQTELNSSIGNIEKFSSAIENSSKSSSKSNKETEKSIYVTDKYRKAMDQLTLAIERQQAIREESIRGSNKSRLALVEEIKLEEQRLKLMKDQASALKKQISTGRIQQTGNVKQSQTQTVSAGQKIGGAFDGRITSTFGSRADNHRGVDFAAPRGTSINSPVAGKVIAAGDAKSQGWHWSYGNLVVVQDDSGIKHIMAHMDKVAAKVGDQIVAGVKVGTVGSTGNSTGNHLHYEQNKNGKVLNPNATVEAIRNGTLTTTGGTSVVGVETGAEAIDKAQSDAIQIEKDITAQEKRLNELRAMLVDEILQNYENKKDAYDRTLQNVENNMKKLTESSEAYRFELDKQGKALQDKRKVNQEELIYLQNVISKGTLSDKALGELQNRLQELKNENAQIDLAINDNYLAKIASLNAMLEETVDKYNKLRDAQDKTIAYQTVQLREIDSTSKEYAKALIGINEAMKVKQAANRQELSDITKLINNGKYYGEALTNAKNRVQELQLQIKELQLDIQEGNFEILINIKNNSDETVKDIQFEMSRLEEIRKMYEQGSGDYLKYTNDLIAQQKLLADQHLKTRDALKEELKQQDISKDRIREIKRLLEAEHISYLQATNAIKDYTNQLEKANDARKEDIANKVISALKAAIQEVRDEHLKAIDETIKKENDAHNLRLKQLKDEQDLFRKNVEERLRLIDRQEAERGYNMEIEELEKERSKVQERMFEISNDNSYSAKKERKQLQEQLDKIDKDIAERRHDRDIELQKQGLSDLLELKEQEIEGREEAENEYFNAEIDRLNKQKAYWEKHYNDLLNDERKFAKMREDIMVGNFAAIEAEFKDYIDRLSATMPQLADTMDGTMRAVGMTIRQNVIDELQAAIDAMKEFQSLAAITNSFQDDFSSNIGGGKEGNSGGLETSKGNLSSADMKVLMGKFLYDNVAPALTGSAQTSARNTGRQLGQSGYSQGATIDEGLNFGSAMTGLTSAEVEAFKNYLRSNIGMNGGAYDKYIQQFLGGNSDISNTVNRYGVKTPMSYGDMQVLMAKYMREILITPNSPQTLKDEIIPQANSLAQSGRSAGSVVSSDVTYGAVLNSLDKAQRAQFKSFLSNQSGIIKNQDLKNKAKSYAASLDTGGMLNFSGAGIDGKGGKLIIAHDGEVVSNPIETAQLLDTVDSSRVMLQHLASLVRPLNSVIEAMGDRFIGGGITEEYNFIFQGEYYNINEQMLRRMAGGAMDQVRTTKGIFGNNRR